MGERTALTNQIRSVLLERGHVVAQGRAKLTACLAALLDTDAGASLTLRMRTLVAEVRDLAAWLDLVPRQVTTGGKPRLVGITKRGSKYLRKTLVQGARAALPSLSQSDTHLGQWLRGLLARSHVNTAVVALAVKMARIAWALLRHGRVYEPAAVAA